MQSLRYSITLNEAQLDYLSDEQQDILRMKCLKTFIRMAVLEETKVSGKNFSAVLQPGQFVASKVDLAREWECNRKTATRIVHEFNQLGILRSESTNRTTIHTLICLSRAVSSTVTLWSSQSRNRIEFPSMSHLKSLSKPVNPTAQILRTQVGHRRSIPASFPFPFIPNRIEKRRRKREPSGDRDQQRKHPCPVAPTSFMAILSEPRLRLSSMTRLMKRSRSGGWQI